jgi:hypothetical protein
MTKNKTIFEGTRVVGDSATVSHIEKQLTSRHLERAIAPQPAPAPPAPTTSQAPSSNPKK